jgi:predicted transcriptional regulator
MAMILESLHTGATKTRLMYNALLSYAQLKEYLAFLQENELIKNDPSTRLYSMTEKGKQFLKAYHKISGIVPQK